MNFLVLEMATGQRSKPQWGCKRHDGRYAWQLFWETGVTVAMGKAPNVLGIASSTNFNACTVNLTSFGNDLRYIINMVGIALIKRKDTGPRIDQMKIEIPNKCQPQSRNCKRDLKSIVRKRR